MRKAYILPFIVILLLSGCAEKPAGVAPAQEKAQAASPAQTDKESISAEVE